MNSVDLSILMPYECVHLYVCKLTPFTWKCENIQSWWQINMHIHECLIVVFENVGNVGNRTISVIDRKKTNRRWWKSRLPIRLALKCYFLYSEPIHQKSSFAVPFSEKPNTLNYMYGTATLCTDNCPTQRNLLTVHECLITDFHFLDMLGISHWLHYREPSFAFQTAEENLVFLSSGQGYLIFL